MTETTRQSDLRADLDQFCNIALSALSTHEGDCCKSAHLGIRARLAHPTVAASLAAIPHVISWGPTRWPAFWCDLEQEPTTYIGDCGVHAALAADTLRTFDVPHERVQIAIASPLGHHAHWRASWLNADANSAWIGEATVYHEALRVGDRYWDPSEARFFPGLNAPLLAGRVVAIRIPPQPWTIVDYPASNHG